MPRCLYSAIMHDTERKDGRQRVNERERERETESKSGTESI